MFAEVSRGIDDGLCCGTWLPAEQPFGFGAVDLGVLSEPGDEHSHVRVDACSEEHDEVREGAAGYGAAIAATSTIFAVPLRCITL